MRGVNLTDACEGCPGRCCTRRFWSAVRLTKTEARDPMFKGKLTVTEDGELALSMGKQACFFLEKGRCSIYENRPMACRGYVCHTAGGYSSQVIEEFPALKAHLKRKKIKWAPEHMTHYQVDSVEGFHRRLRDITLLPGHRGKRVFRYNAKTRAYTFAGRFDRKGNFIRTSKK